MSAQILILRYLVYQGISLAFQAECHLSLQFDAESTLFKYNGVVQVRPTCHAVHLHTVYPTGGFYVEFKK